MDAGKQVYTAYFDFKKAFDQVDNDILLQKLAKMGFTSKLLEFFSNFLRNRCQFVRVDGFESKTYHTRSGVSQGSTLGPVMFLIFINDLPNCVDSSKCFLFADDLKLCSGFNTMSDSKTLQADIHAVAE